MLRTSKDDSCIQSRPLPAVPVFRRQRSAEEDRAERRQLRESRALLSRTAAPADDAPPTPLNQTFPLAGHPESGHRALRSFIKNKKASSSAGSRRRYSRDSTASSVVSEASCDGLVSGHATVLERPCRTHPDGGEAPPAPAEELGSAVFGTMASLSGFCPQERDDEQPYLDMTGGPGVPAHTSTPKATPMATPKATPRAAPLSTPALLAPVENSATPTRRVGPAGRRHYDKRSARPVNLLNDFDK